MFGVCFILISRAECWFGVIYSAFPWIRVWLQPKTWNCDYREGVDEVQFQRIGTGERKIVRFTAKMVVVGETDVSECSRAKDRTVTSRFLRDSYPKNRMLSWMCQVFAR